MELALQEIESAFEQWLSQEVSNHQIREEGMAYMQKMREIVHWYTQDIRRDSLEAKEMLGSVSNLMDTEDVIQGPDGSSDKKGGTGSVFDPKALAERAFGTSDVDEIKDMAKEKYNDVKSNMMSQIDTAKDWLEDAIKNLKADNTGSTQGGAFNAEMFKESNFRKNRISSQKNNNKNRGHAHTTKSGLKSSKKADKRTQKPISKVIKGRDLETRLDKFFLAADAAWELRSRFSKDFITKFKTLTTDQESLSVLKQQNKYLWKKRTSERQQQLEQMLTKYNIFDISKHTDDKLQEMKILDNIQTEISFIIKVLDNRERLQKLRERYRSGHLSETRFFQALRLDPSWKETLDWLFNKAGHASILLFKTFKAPPKQMNKSRRNALGQMINRAHSHGYPNPNPNPNSNPNPNPNHNTRDNIYRRDVPVRRKSSKSASTKDWGQKLSDAHPDWVLKNEWE